MPLSRSQDENSRIKINAKISHITCWTLFIAPIFTDKNLVWNELHCLQRIDEAEAELRGLQRTCREMIVRSAASPDAVNAIIAPKLARTAGWVKRVVSVVHRSITYTKTSQRGRPEGLNCVILVYWYLRVKTKMPVQPISCYATIKVFPYLLRKMRESGMQSDFFLYWQILYTGTFLGLILSR